MLLLDLGELEALDAHLRLWGRNRARLVSFHDGDHFRDARRSVEENLRAAVEAEGHAWPGGRVTMLTHCRVFGYVFNPVSFFYCHDPQGELAVMVAEVNNTFGDRHCYVLPVSASERVAVPAGRERFRWTAKKLMHVSPFFPMDGSYLWEFDVPAERLYARVDVTVRGARQFTASLALTRTELTDAALGLALVRYPLMTAKVMAAIHWEALKLWWKGAPFHSQPPYDPDAARRGVA